MPRVTVKPAEGRRVRLPGELEPMAEEWREVERDTFVARRLADGDLVEKPAEAAEATQPEIPAIPPATRSSRKEAAA